MKASKALFSARLPTGTSGLDDILRGGLMPERMYLVEGQPGSGKTTLGLKFLLEGARRGETVLYIALSESRAEVQEVARSHGWDLSPVGLFELNTSEKQLDDENTLFHPSEVELHDAVRAIIQEVERLRPKRIVIDSLSELRLLAQNPLRYRRQILALKNYFAGKDTTVLVLDDRLDADANHQVQSLVHGIILLEQSVPPMGTERRRLTITKMRAVSYRGGAHDFKIRKGGLEVFPRLVAAEHRTASDKKTEVASGVKNLDTLLGGGIDRGTSTLLLGPAGSGKSTIAMQYVHSRVKAGEKAAMFLFEERAATLLRRSRGLGKDLEPFVKKGRLKIVQVDPAELSPGEFSHLVRQAVEDGAGMVVIDSLNGYLNAMPEERHLIIQMHELLTFLGHRGVISTLVVAQQGLIGTNMPAPVDATYLADTVILFRYYELGGTVKQAISVMKKRVGRHERTLRELSMGKDGVRIGEPLSHFRAILTGVPVQDGSERSVK